MSFEQWFSLAGSLAMIGWLILIFLPRRWIWLNNIPAFIIPATIAFGYTLLVARYFFSAEGNFSTLAGVQELFTVPSVALAGWVHYLAFDLFIGGIIAKQSDALGISRLIQAPLLLLTFMFGPFGLLLFLLTKKLMTSFDSKLSPSTGV